jgi:tight adherence protein B
MSRPRLRRALLLVPAAVAISLSAPAYAQPASGGIEIGAVETASFPNVAVTLSVPAEVTPAVAAKVTLMEAGQRRDVSVEALPSDDLGVVLAIDTSGSMSGTPLDAAKDAATQFLSRLPERTPVAVIGFGEKVTVSSAFTTDKINTRQAIAGLRPRGETTLFDAVVTAAQLFPNESSARRVVVLLTDGADTRSTNDLKAALDAVDSSKATVHSVALQTRETDYAALQAFASASKGLVASAEDPRALAETFARVTDAVVNRYRLTWAAGASGATNVSIRFDTASGTPLQRDVALTYPVIAAPAPADAAAASSSSPLLSPTTPPVHQVEPSSIVRGSALLLIGGATLFIALILVGHMILQPRFEIRRLSRELGVETKTQLSGLSQRAVGAVDRAISRSNRRVDLESLLQQAGLGIAPAEAASVVAACAVIVFLGALMAGGPIWAVASAAMVFGAAAMWLKLRVDVRARRFANQLDSTLQLMVSSLRTGYGIAQAVDAVASEAPSPTREEFRRAARETRIGRDLSSALRDVAFRAKNEDFAWVVDAIEINREVGGSLAEVLENTSITLRDRSRLARQVRALSAEGRLSGAVLVALPLLLLVYLRMSNPDYLDPLFHSSFGQRLMLVGVGLLVAGAAWLRRIVQVKY